MPIAITPGSTFWYQLREDRLDEKTNPDAAEFELGPLTAAEEAALVDASFELDSTGTLQRFNVGTNGYRRLLYALRGWRNFKDEHGKDVPFLGHKNPANLERIALRHRTELGEAQRERYSLTAAEGN